MNGRYRGHIFANSFHEIDGVKSLQDYLHIGSLYPEGASFRTEGSTFRTKGATFRTEGATFKTEGVTFKTAGAAFSDIFATAQTRK
eukprot:2921570-Pleurochrysis_carterae.AAC.1